jgi:ribosomal protein L13
MNTTMAKAETVQRGWWVIDAADQRVGRLAVIVANILRGKHKPEYTPSPAIRWTLKNIRTTPITPAVCAV